jgi:hypothetical protein
MKSILLLIITVLLILTPGCSKEKEVKSLADTVAGAYIGSTGFDVVRIPCTSVLSKNDDTHVSLTINYPNDIFTFGNLSVYAGGNSTYILSYSDPGGTISGTVKGDSLTYSVNNGILNTLFSGIRSQ